MAWQFPRAHSVTGAVAAQPARTHSEQPTENLLSHARRTQAHLSRCGVGGPSRQPSMLFRQANDRKPTWVVAGWCMEVHRGSSVASRLHAAAIIRSMRPGCSRCGLVPLIRSSSPAITVPIERRTERLVKPCLACLAAEASPHSHESRVR